ncbi:MAG: RNA-binding protein [Verrucomicrobiae bacterium]|nr:RNA-binding protein [Verrucomicrobiae bacterium]
MSTRLYVGNLPFSTIEGDLETLFNEAGPVKGVEIVMDKFTGRSRGFGFVEMADQGGADKAVSIFHGKDFNGRPLVVNEARPREERPPRSGYGDGGGRGFDGPRRPRSGGGGQGRSHDRGGFGGRDDRSGGDY